VFSLLDNGHTRKEIAKQTGVSVATIDNWKQLRDKDGTEFSRPTVTKKKRKTKPSQLEVVNLNDLPAIEDTVQVVSFRMSKSSLFDLLLSR